ncbi:MAG TPA: DUF2867 domain-containing protein [Vicinamibacterales bacterium]|jgi:hypothetical protein
MRVSPAEYLGLPLRAHELLHDVALYDVSVVGLPGGGYGRTIADVRALDSGASHSRIAIVVYQLRRFFGLMFGWDRQRIRPEESLLRRLTDRDRRNSEVPPGTFDGDFLVLYRFPHEELREILNATVHGFLCMALLSTPTGYRLYWAVYVRRVSWLTRPYLVAIEPFRWMLYPAMLRRIRRSWIATYGAAV